MALGKLAPERKLLLQDLKKISSVPKIVTYGYLAGVYGTGQSKSGLAVSEILNHDDLLCYSPFVVSQEQDLFVISTENSTYEFQLKKLKEAGIFPKPLNKAPIELHKTLSKKYDLSDERLIDENDVWEACRLKFAA